MKQKVIILGTLAALVIVTTFMINKNSIKEEVLYSQSILNGEKQEFEEKGECITRGQVLMMADEIWSQEYGLNMKEGNLEMHVNLYKDVETYNCYAWLMSWYDYEKEVTYTCTFNAENGKLLYLFAGVKGDAVPDASPPKLSYAELTAVVDKFFNLIGLDVNDYEMQVSYPLKDNSYNYWYQKCSFINKETGKEDYQVFVSSDGEYVIEFATKG